MLETFGSYWMQRIILPFSRSQRPRRATIHIENRALDVGCLRGGQKGNRASNLCRIAEAGDFHLTRQALPGLIDADVVVPGVGFHACLQPFCRNRAGIDGIDSYSIPDAAVREAVMSMDEPEGTLPTGYGVKFDEKGQNTRAKPVVVQWRAGGEKVTVFPEAAAGGESIELSR